MQEIFGEDNFYLELQDHGIREQTLVNRELLRIHQETGIPLVCTNDAHYLRPEDAESHDVLLCIQTGKTVDDENRMRYEPRNFYLRSTEEMEELFGAYPERRSQHPAHRRPLPTWSSPSASIICRSSGCRRG